MSVEVKTSQAGAQGSGLQRVSRFALQEGAGLVAMLVIIIVAMTLLSDVFLSRRNIENVFLQSAIVGMIAIGSTMLMVGGGLDLSVGAVAALVGVVVAQLMPSVGMGGSIIIGLLVGTGIGFINGFSVTIIGINPLITTLGMLSIVTGVVFVLSGGLSVTTPDANFMQVARLKIADAVHFPVVVAAILFVAAQLVMQNTRYGRAMYAIGGNREASYLAALPVQRYQMAAYMLSGFSAALGGVFLAARLGAGDPKNALSGIELTVIAAVVLGGTSLAGGKGNLFGTLIGVLILGTLNNGMGLLSVSSYYQQIARGAVLLLAVGLDQVRVGGLGRITRAKS